MVYYNDWADIESDADDGSTVDAGTVSPWNGDDDDGGDSGDDGGTVDLGTSTGGGLLDAYDDDDSDDSGSTTPDLSTTSSDDDGSSSSTSTSTSVTGTSGGALCALVAWYGLRTADAATARRGLADLWADIETRGPVDSLVNFGVVSLTRLLDGGFPVAQISPAYNAGARMAKRRLRNAIEAQVDPAFDAVSLEGSEVTVFLGSNVERPDAVAPDARENRQPRVDEPADDTFIQQLVVTAVQQCLV